MNVPTEKNFELSKVKIGKGGGLDVHFETQEAIGNEIYTEKHHLESAKDVHPDLANLIEDLRPIVGRVFNMTSFLSMVDTPDFKATKKQTEFSRSFADELLENIEVRGITLSGKEDKVGVIVTSVLSVLNGKTAINTPRIILSSEKFGFEQELEEIIHKIEKEVYLFLFKGKKAQLELFDPNGDATNTDEGAPFPDVADPATDGDEDDGLWPDVDDENE